MIIRVLYMLPMLLGRTFDVKKNEVGVDIFSLDSVAKPRVIEEFFYRSRFKTVEAASDVKDVLEINGDLSLAIKAGMLTFRGMGSYIKESLSSQNSVDILTKVSFRTVSKTLPHSVRPIPTWANIGKQYLGTHFVRSILYGGDLIACVRFKAAKREYLQNIRATIKSSLEKGSALDLVGEGKLESLDQKLEKNATMEINYYATVPLEGVPNTIPGLRELVKNFEKHVKKVNDGIGVPVEVELEELSTLNEDFTFQKNKILETELQFFEEYFDDLLSTKADLKSWIETLPDTITQKEERLISEFSDRISTVIGKFIDTISKLDMESGVSQLEPAKEAYRDGSGLALAGKFRRELKKLMKKVVIPNDERDDQGSTLYVHYGSSKCTKEKYTSTLHSGYASSSPRNISGVGYNYLCMPKEPDGNQEKDVSDDEGSPIAGVKYGLLENSPFRISDDTVLRGTVCAVCLVKQRQSIFTFLGKQQCPEGEWTLQYSGYIMSSSDVDRSENICMDSKLETHRDNDAGQSDQSINFVLTENAFLPCAVCSR